VPAGASTSDPANHDEDGDIDALGKRYDNDGDASPGFGRPASAADRRAIVSLIKRYYALAAGGDGAKACSMLDVVLAETYVEEHHVGRGPRSLQGDTCAQALSKLFEQRHRELVEDVASYHISYVEVRGNNAMALAPFLVTREMQLLLHRERGVWKMNVLLDNSAQ